MSIERNFVFSQYTTATSELATWKTITTSTGHESAYMLINQGVSNDNLTLCCIEMIIKETETAPSTSELGIKLMTGDSVSNQSISPFWLYTRTTTANATIQLVEYAIEAM